MQEGQVICYHLRNLNEHENKYLTHGLEFAVIIHALKMWRHCPLSRRFVLISDHIRLRYLFDQVNMNSYKALWSATINEFDFKISNIKGKENRVENALNR